MLKQSKSPDGYKHLLVYQKSEALLADTLRFTAIFPRNKTGVGLADQMDRSVRSVKANVVEGWKRNATHEYYQFLGYAIASNAELLEDYLDICFGRYETKGIKGMNGGNGEEKGEKGKMRREELERTRFYPLDKTLPEAVQLYLRCKEINMLLQKLQESLVSRMQERQTLSEADRRRLVNEKIQKKQDDAEEWTRAEWQRLGLVMTGRGVKKKEEAERLGLVWWHYGEPEK